MPADCSDKKDLSASNFNLSSIRERIAVSFEFFPPATPQLGAKLWTAVEKLAPINPAFMSVTYGAGGSTRDRTHATVKRILAETDVPPAAHLTCVGASQQEVDTVAHAYHVAGVRHIVALRGDPPHGATAFTPHPGGYENAAALVAGLKRIADFDISVAAYPEKHPAAPSMEADLDNLKRKIDAGAKRAITQCFFDTEVFLRFVDRARATGISVPIIPGILPVTNFARVCEFSARCGTAIPTWLADAFAGLDDAPEVRRLVAASVAIAQCEQLAAHGVRDFHFYTLNRWELTTAICHKLGVRARSPVATQRLSIETS
jgi:methylenetetrahydrofolate reductase (NADPH)